jgi:hypothetical protein
LFTAAVHATNSNGQQFAIANGGRVPDSRYSIEVWPRQGDCPFPSVNDKSWNELKSHGIDTVFMNHVEVGYSCHSSVGALTQTQSEKEQLFLWTSIEGAREVAEDKKFYISAVLIADEDDGDANKDVHLMLFAALLLAKSSLISCLIKEEIIDTAGNFLESLIFRELIFTWLLLCSCDHRCDYYSSSSSRVCLSQKY